MPIDPAQGIPTTPERRTAERLAELERDVRRLGSANPTVQSGQGPPTIAAAGLRTGTSYIDETNNRIYYVVAGNWRYAALT